ncbi:recombination mediator RecR [Candidatus Saccharibacteria bacterium]|nr:recombination mediator RecR [Candidatus Saccharibacteria bacterium]
MLPKALQDATSALGCLPGVGARTAERYACYLLKNDPIASKRIAMTLAELHTRVKTCPKTFALISEDEEVSALYENPGRDRSVILVVEEALDLVAIEKTGEFKGVYHVLGGAISPIDDVTPDKLHFRELIDRVEEDDVKEVIVATNASIEGESTAIYLQHELSGRYPDLKISRLARGIPMGVDLGYTDQLTLSQALKGRTIL